MNISICLDQYASNYNVNNLSSNGFNIYTDLDNFTNPIAQGIPYQNLFSAPIGNCPYLLTNVPAGATQLLVIDSCTSNPLLPGSTTPTSQELLIDCCYALIDLYSTPPITSSFCTTCSLDFDVFSSSYVGQIVAGNLTSACGPVTDYTIGWYKDGDYSSPEFISGYGNAFLPYQNLHPLTGNQSVPASAGDWEGVIHDIAINGIIYSSVSGSANGQPIPFETCFDTIVVDPLTCNNGSTPPPYPYSHNINYNSQAVGTSPNPVSLTYNLSSTTKYFAYLFEGNNVWDELEIKWKSGNPAATSNPSLYSQPIYLEKIKIGSDAPSDPVYTPASLTNRLPVVGNPNTLNITTPASSVVMNNVWPKSVNTPGWFQRVLTLTSLETSSNPLLPDQLEITITPSPSNNNTQWQAGFQCLDDFDCTNCVWDNYPNNLPKIYKIWLQKQHGCDKQQLKLFPTTSCDPFTQNSDWFSLVSPYNPPYPTQIPIPITPIQLTPVVTCLQGNYGEYSCGPSSTGQITLNKTPNQIQLTFNLESDYTYYKDALIDEYFQTYNVLTPTPLTSSISCTGTTDVRYYRYFKISIPTQGANANCGDNTILKQYYFHFNDYFNITYVENPSSNSWSITIPQTPMVNCYPQNLGCDSCYNTINDWVNLYNTNVNDFISYTFTTNVGAKYNVPVYRSLLTRASSGGTSGSYCGVSTEGFQSYSWYNVYTIPFVSSSTGWVNLDSFKSTLPCTSSSYPNGVNSYIYGVGYRGTQYYYQARFPHLTGSFNYTVGDSTNDFEIYALAGYGPTGSNHFTLNVSPLPCPDPSGSKIYSYIGGVATMYSSSHFWNGTTPTLIIDP